LLSRSSILETIEILELLSRQSRKLEYSSILRNRLLVINNIKAQHPSSQAWALLPTSSAQAQLAKGQTRSSPRPWEEQGEQGEEEQAFPLSSSPSR
jgi:hypothetical protein